MPQGIALPDKNNAHPVMGSSIKFAMRKEFGNSDPVPRGNLVQRLPDFVFMENAIPVQSDVWQ
jgi:hypothetical protein